MKKEVSEKLSNIKREEVGEPFDKKDDSFIHIKRVRTYLRSGSEDSSDDPGNQDDLKHKNKKLKLNKENKEDTYQGSENEEEDFSEDPKNEDDYKKWKRLKDYYKDSSDESEDEKEEYNRWKRRKKQVMEIIRRNNTYRAENCRGEGAVEQENSKPTNVTNSVTKVKSLLAERFHLASCSQLTDSETENEEEDNNSENKDTEDKNDQQESPDEIMLSESSMSEEEEREIANCFNQIQEIINRRFNGNNVNNDNQQRENANENPEDNNSSDGHSQNGENQPEENNNLDSEGERTIHSSRGSTRSFNSTLEEELFMDIQDPSKFVFSEQERLNIMSYNEKFRSNPGHWMREPINGELEIATSDRCEVALTRVRNTLRGERHNGRFDRAAVVNGHSIAQVSRAIVKRNKVRELNSEMDLDKTDRYKIDKERKRLDRWEENLQKKVEGYTKQKRMLDVRRNRLKAMDDFERELSAVESDDKEYDRDEIAAQRRSLNIIKRCEEARGRNVFDVGKYRVEDSEGNAVADIKAIYVVRDLRHQSDERSFSYEIKTTIVRGTTETTIRARESKQIKYKPIEEAKTTKQSSETSTIQKTMFLPQQPMIQQHTQQQQELPQLIVLPTGEMGSLRRILPRPPSMQQTITYQQTGGTEKRKRGGDPKGKNSAKKPSKPTVKSSIQIKPPTKKQKTRKSAEEAKMKIKQSSKEEDEHSSESDNGEHLKLPTRIAELKKSILSKILIKDLPRSMGSDARSSHPSSNLEQVSGEACRPTDQPEARGMEDIAAETTTDILNKETDELDDCSFESLASTQILEAIPEAVAQAIISEGIIQPAGQSEAIQPTTQPAGRSEAFQMTTQPAGRSEAFQTTTQPAGRGEAYQRHAQPAGRSEVPRDDAEYKRQAERAEKETSIPSSQPRTQEL
ncbi:general transcriptional corepressor trfA-like [Temnothorax curvispinosus]|uniref:General transcriptional corepressor trfA-like n=1 Tax=Temnothorax curvispinosus TaxID=300111 RepID=A0A6J1PT90_9HYME|nr:general transcriptional corepressor trfA-like [Temnothorax curvispinosus]